MNHERIDQTLERIAREELEITTLEPRNDPEEDTHRLTVWEIRTIMERAYESGFEAAVREHQA